MNFRKFSQDLKRDIKIIFLTVIVASTLQLIMGLWNAGYFTVNEQILLFFAAGLVTGWLVYRCIKPWITENDDLDVRIARLLMRNPSYPQQ